MTGLIARGLGVRKSAAPRHRIPGASILLGLKEGIYEGGTLADCLQHSHSNALTDLFWDSPSSAYDNFAANVPAIAPGRGIFHEEARSNLLATPTAPETETVTIASAGVHVLWVIGPGSYAVSAGTATLSNVTGGGVATQGHWISFSTTTGTITVTRTGALSAAQLEKGLAPTSFMPTDARPNTSRVRFTGAARDLLKANAGTLLVKAKQSVATLASSVFPSLINFNAATLCKYTSDKSFFGSDSSGAALLGYSLGYGDWDNAWVALSWNNSSNRRAMSINGCPPQTGSKLVASAFSDSNWLLMSNFGTTGTFWNGFIEEIQIFPTELRGDALAELTDYAKDGEGVMFGNSLTKNGQDGLALTVASQLGEITGKKIVAAGQDGQSSSGIRTRLLSVPGMLNRLVVIETGSNELTAPSTVLTNVGNMVADLQAAGTQHWLVLAPLNRTDQANPSTAYSGLQTIIAGLQAYGPRFVNMWQRLRDDHDPANAKDVFDIAAGIVPFSFRAVLGQDDLNVDIDDTQTSGFNAGVTVSSGVDLQIGAEFIRVTGNSGFTITNCIRGVAGVRSAHLAGTATESRDQIHIGGDTGCLKVAQYIAEAIEALAA